MIGYWEHDGDEEQTAHFIVGDRAVAKIQRFWPSLSGPRRTPHEWRWLVFVPLEWFRDMGLIWIPVVHTGDSTTAMHVAEVWAAQ